MSSSSKTQRGNYDEMAEKITEVAIRAIREAVKASQANKGVAEKSSESRKAGK